MKPLVAAVLLLILLVAWWFLLDEGEGGPSLHRVNAEPALGVGAPGTSPTGPAPPGSEAPVSPPLTAPPAADISSREPAGAVPADAAPAADATDVTAGTHAADVIIVTGVALRAADGTAIIGATVSRADVTTQTGAGGRFRLEAPAAGLEDAAPFDITCAWRQQSARQTWTGADLVFVLDTGWTLTGRLHDHAGNPVGDAEVRVDLAPLTDGGAPLARPVVDATGSFVVRDLEHGRPVHITATAPWRLQARTRADTPEAGLAQRHVELLLRDAGTIAGRLTGPGGRAASDTRLRLLTSVVDGVLHVSDPDDDNVPAASVDEDGRYRFPLIPPGWHVLEVGSAPQAATRTLLGPTLVIAGQVSRLDGALAPATLLAGAVVGVDLAPRAGLTVESWSLVDVGGDPDTPHAFLEHTDITALDGRFSLRGSSPGNKELLVWPTDSDEPVVRQLLLSPAGRSDLRIILGGTAQFTGRAVDEHGAPLANVLVHTAAPDAPAPAETWTGLVQPVPYDHPLAPFEGPLIVHFTFHQTGGRFFRARELQQPERTLRAPIELRSPHVQPIGPGQPAGLSTRWQPEDHAPDVTDATGRFALTVTVEHSQSEDLHVILTAPGRLAARLPLDIPGGARNLGDVTLSPAPLLVVSIRDARQGDDMRDFTAVITDELDGHRRTLTAHAHPYGAPAFVTWGTPGRTLHLELTAPDHVPVRHTWTVPDSGVTRIDIALRRHGG